MNAVQKIRFQCILSRLEDSLSKPDILFIEHLVAAAPETLDRHGRRIASSILAMNKQCGLDVAESQEQINRLIAVGILFRSPKSPTISFHRFKPPRKKLVVCVYCRRNTRTSRDHVIPLGQGGRDHESNIVPACDNCNLSKGNRTPTQWASGILRYKQPAPAKKVRRIPVVDWLRLTAALVAVFVVGLFRMRGDS